MSVLVWAGERELLWISSRVWFFCTCVAVEHFMPVDEWEFVCLPQSGSSVHAWLWPTHGYLYPRGDIFSAVRREVLWKQGSIIVLGIVSPQPRSTARYL